MPCRKTQIIILVFVLVLAGFALFTAQEKQGEVTTPTPPDRTTPTVFLGDAEIAVQVADTPQERARGLSGREALEENKGMLFVFEVSDAHGFWMKDMNFAIDIIWISEEKEVVHIEENVAPETYPKVFRPSDPAKYVLEVPAGFTNKYNVKVGDHAKISHSY